VVESPLSSRFQGADPGIFQRGRVRESQGQKSPVGPMDNALVGYGARSLQKLKNVTLMTYYNVNSHMSDSFVALFHTLG